MSVEDRVRTASEATAASVRQIRPLALPGNSAVPAGQCGHPGRNAPRAGGPFQKIKKTWIIPLAAAAAVGTLALSLVTLRHAEGPRPVPSQAGTAAAPGPRPVPSQASTAAAPVVEGIPRYYAIASEGQVGHDGKAVIKVTVGYVRTGKTLATVALPAVYVTIGVNSAVGVSATADDRSFVVGRRNMWGGLTYFLVRIAPGAKQVATVEHLPIPDAALGKLLGFAVSPDGRELAVLSLRGNGTTLRIYSVKSGATLRTWIAGTWRYQGYGPQQVGVSWTADSRQVAFSTVAATGVLQERVIGTAEPSGDLAAASKVVFKGPGTCSSLLLTPDGGTVVCATWANFPSPTPGSSPRLTSPADCGKNGKTGPMLAAFSAATGQLLRVLDCHYALTTVLWSDDSARHVIGVSRVTFHDNAYQYTYGMVTAGKFTAFRVPQLGQTNSGPAF